jgi:hypothetical protein
MGSWYYLWENGDVSLVSASSKESAAFMLDEVGAAHPERLKPIPEGFFIGFKTKHPAPEDAFEWEQEDISESALGILADLEEEARRRVIPDTVTEPINLLGLFSSHVSDTAHLLGEMKDFNLKEFLEKKVCDSVNRQYLQAAVDLVEAYLKNKKTTLAEQVCTWKQLHELLEEIIDTERSVIYREKKGSV